MEKGNKQETAPVNEQNLNERSSTERALTEGTSTGSTLPESTLPESTLPENALTERELQDQELQEVNGGVFNPPVYWDNIDDVEYIYEVGEEVEVASGWGFGTTVRCKITDRRKGYFRSTTTGLLGTPILFGYRDEYFCEAIDPPFYFLGDKTWTIRSDIEK